MESSESVKRKGKSKESLETQILADLERHTPWNVIAKKYHVSTKTIAGIRGKREGVKGEGELAAEAFEVFQKGVTPTNVVVRLKVQPQVVKELFEQWKDMTEHLNRFCQKCYDRALEYYKEHYNKGVIYSHCSKCGRDIYWNLDKKEDKEQVMSILKQGGIGNWHHVTCPQEQKK